MGDEEGGRSVHGAVPQLAAATVDRPLLLERLDAVLDRPVTLVTGPAGSGKSSLVAQWCRLRCPVPVVWLDVGREDGLEQVMDRVAHQVTELTGVVARPESGEWLAPGGSTMDRAGLDRLAGAAAGLPETVFVIDGLRPFGPASLYGDLALAFERSAVRAVHLVTVSRSAAPTEITPLELRGAAGRIDGDDLRLDVKEFADVFAAYSGRPLDQVTGKVLATRLDGWMVAAVLAGMSDPGDSPSSAGDVVDAAFDRIDAYVSHEILADLDGETRRFLMQMACVDELTTPLCNAITGRNDAEGLLTLLRQVGLPIVRGSSGAGSFRLLRPFREVLDAHAQRDDPDARDAALLTGAASYSDGQRPFDAARCWARLGDWDKVLDILLLHLRYILENDMFSELAELVEMAPSDQIRRHQSVALAAAWVLRMDGRIAASHEMLSVHQPWMTAEGRMIADVGRGSTASWVDDMAAPLGFAEAAVAACDELGDDRFDTHVGEYTESSTDQFRTMARGAAVLASCYGGFWIRGASHLVDIRPDTVVHMPNIYLVQIHGARATYLTMAGEIGRALSEAREALTVAAGSNLDQHRCTADALYALGEAQRLASIHDGVAELFQRSLALAEVNGRRNLVAAVTASQAHLLVDAGDPDEALVRLGQWLSNGDRLPRGIAGHVAAAAARALTASGAPARALHRLDVSDPTPVTASCRVVVCLALGDLAGAHRTVEQWPMEPTVDSAVRGALAASVVADIAGDARAADGAIGSALKTAADHQLVQPFVEAGALIGRLLQRVGGSGNGPAEELARRVQALMLGGKVSSLEPLLTDREVAVISQLAAGRSLPEVANEIHLSVNTVKTHVKTIYRKLGVSNRVEAINAWNTFLADRQDD